MRVDVSHCPTAALRRAGSFCIFLAFALSSAAVPQTSSGGTITIIKKAVPHDLENFAFEGDLGKFQLDDDEDVKGADSDLTNMMSFNVSAGRYSVTENRLDGWKLTALSCNPDADATTDRGARTARINVRAGDTVTCTFTNSRMLVRDPSDLLESRKRRALRMFTIELEYLDQADEFFTLDSLPDDHDLEHPGMPHPDPDPSVPRTFSRRGNPDDNLLKGQIGVSFERFFRSPSELGSVYAAAVNHPGLVGFVEEEDSIVAAGVKSCLGKGRTEEKNDQCTRLRFFSRTRPGEHSKRIFSAFTLSVGLSERARTVSGIAIPREFRGDKWGETYTVKFDPQKLRLQPSRLKTAYEALVSYTKLYELNDPLGDSAIKDCKVGEGPIACLSTLSTIGVGRRWFRFLPSIEVQTVDQFDFAAIGGRFFLDAGNEETIESYKLVWDLKAVFDDRDQKIAALDAIKRHKELAADLPLIKSSALLMTKGEFFYEKLKGARIATWAEGEKRDACQSWPKGIQLESNGLVVGTPTDSQSSTEVCVVVTDSVGRSVRGAIKVTVESSTPLAGLGRGSDSVDLSVASRTPSG